MFNRISRARSDFRVWQVELLESRRLLAAVVWDGGGGNTSWNDPLNWSGDVVPSAADDVSVSSAVSITAPGAQAKSLVTSAPITFSPQCSLETDSLTLKTDGQLIGGILDTLGASGVIASGGSGFDSMIVESNWLMTGYLNVSSGLTMNGVMTAGNATTHFIGILGFQETYNFLGGGGRVELGYTSSNISLSNVPRVTRTLEIGPGLTIRTTAGTAWSIAVAGLGTSSKIINHARLESTVAGGTLSLGIEGSTSLTEQFTNDGTIAISNGGSVATYGTFSSTAPIAITNGNLNFSGSVTPATVNLVHRTGPGTTALLRTLDLSVTPLNLTATTGSLELRSGSSLTGPGFVNTSGGAQVVCNPTIFTPVNLSNVVINGTVQLGTYSTRLRGNVTLAGTMIGGFSSLTFDAGATLTAADGARLSNVQLGGIVSLNADGASLYVDGGLRSASIRFNGNGNRVIAEGTQTWTNVACSFLKPAAAVVLKGSAATLTLGTGSSISSGTGSVLEDSTNTGHATLINQGTIRAVTGRSININLPGGVTNLGTMQIDATGTLSLDGPLLQTAGSIILNGGLLTASAPMDVTGGAYVVRSGAYVFDPAAFVSTEPLNVSVDSTGQLTFSSLTTRLASLTVRQTGKVVVASGGGRVIRVESLGILDTGKLDLNDNGLIVDYSASSPTSPIDGIRAAVAAGRNGGAWNGSGISSTTAAGTPGTALGIAESTDLFGTFPAMFANQSVDSTAVLVRYTRAGDANLDQTVNDVDYAVLQANLGQSPRRFSQGDFNYDGVVDAADRGILFSQFSQTMSATPSSVEGRVFDDVDVDGIFDTGELGIAGRTAYLDVNGNNSLDVGEPSRLTDALGRFAFSLLGPGNYRIRQVLPAGWTQTTPSVPGLDFAISQNQTIAGADFGSVAEMSRVAGVFLSGSEWSAEFLSATASQSLGDATFGYGIDAADQLKALPWTNVNRVSIRFSHNVNVAQANLVVTGVTIANYGVSTFAYDATTFTATWTLNTTGVLNDKLLLNLANVTDAATGLALDGEWPATTANAFPSGNGTPGGDFHFRINVLPGDVTRNGTVLGNDLTAVRTAQGSAPGSSVYSIFKDLNGSGSILGDDVMLARASQGFTLPTAEPLFMTPFQVRRSVSVRDSFI